MQLTRQQKIYAGVLGLALAAFAFDRFILGPGDDSGADAAIASPASRRTPSQRAPRPQARVAAVAPATGVTTAAVAAAPPGTASSAAPVNTLAVRLQEVARAQSLDPGRVSDAFRPSVKWVGAPRQVTTTAELRDAARDFQMRHRLTAVMKQTAGGLAIIDKTTVVVGQTYDGFRLVAVKDRSAVLRRGNQKVELRLPEEGLPGGTSEKIAGGDTL